MKCRWCKGTGEECGCGYGHCAHCGGSGETTNPPFNAPYVEVLEGTQLSQLCHAFIERDRASPMSDFVDHVAVAASGRTLSQEDTNTFVEYWNDMYRDETIGEFVQRVAARAMRTES